MAARAHRFAQIDDIDGGIGDGFIELEYCIALPVIQYRAQSKFQNTFSCYGYSLSTSIVKAQRKPPPVRRCGLRRRQSARMRKKWIISMGGDTPLVCVAVLRRLYPDRSSRSVLPNSGASFRGSCRVLHARPWSLARYRRDCAGALRS